MLLGEEKKTTDASNFENEKKKEEEKKKKKKKERIRFAYAHRNIVYLDSLERCHEADVVSLIGRWSERRKRK